jgi:hypothetical protein
MQLTVACVTAYFILSVAGDAQIVALGASSIVIHRLEHRRQQLQLLSTCFRNSFAEPNSMRAEQITNVPDYW